MLINQPSIKQHFHHYPNLAVWFVKHNWQTLHERRDYLPPKRIVTRNSARLTRDGKRCLDASPCPRLLYRRPDAVFPLSANTHKHKLPFLMKNTQLRPTFIGQTCAGILSRALRVRFTMVIVSLERSVTVLEAGRGAAAADRLLTPPPRGEIRRKRKPFSNNYLNITIIWKLTNSATCSLTAAMTHLLSWVTWRSFL